MRNDQIWRDNGYEYPKPDQKCQDRLKKFTNPMWNKIKEKHAWAHQSTAALKEKKKKKFLKAYSKKKKDTLSKECKRTERSLLSRRY